MGIIEKLKSGSVDDQSVLKHALQESTYERYVMDSDAPIEYMHSESEYYRISALVQIGEVI
tara:strand:- start:1096 stop:1278 length:183 start_codon:yes stop_codon:yes gene_type:complete